MVTVAMTISMRLVFTTCDEHRRQYHGQRLKVPGGDPQLGGKVGVISLEDVHATVGQGVQHVYEGDEDEGYVDEPQKIVIHTPSGIPGQDEYDHGDYDAVELHQHMEQYIAVHQAEPHQNGQQGQQQNRTTALVKDGRQYP